MNVTLTLRFYSQDYPSVHHKFNCNGCLAVTYLFFKSVIVIGILLKVVRRTVGLKQL